MNYDPNNIILSVGGETVQGFSSDINLSVGSEVIYIKTKSLSHLPKDNPDYSDSNFLVEVCDDPLVYSFELDKEKYLEIYEEYVNGKLVNRDSVNWKVDYE